MKTIAAIIGLGLAGTLLGYHAALPIALALALAVGAIMAALLVVRLLLLIVGLAILLAFAHHVTTSRVDHRPTAAAYRTS